ncbi:hypothetical protein COO59_02785 [Mixta theicola]|uniref:Uncharacterized protein n=2 Tax=Mixta theicola TaxID=1458355 RepID=A0A2K1QCU6_9GAMM|nr:hypothetical protein COO59_02785 [Mixta theicola]
MRTASPAAGLNPVLPAALAEMAFDISANAIGALPDPIKSLECIAVLADLCDKEHRFKRSKESYRYGPATDPCAIARRPAN